jgi:hypothetical protein
MESYKLSMTTLVCSYTLYKITCYHLFFFAQPIIDIFISFSIQFFAYLVEIQQKQKRDPRLCMLGVISVELHDINLLTFDVALQEERVLLNL